MDRLLARLERTALGKLAIERLTLVIVGGMGIVFVLALLRPDFIDWLIIEPRLLLKQPWRLVTFLFVPSTTSLLWILFALSYTYMIGTNLEAEWGAFKFNVYYFIGAAGTLAAALITGLPQGNFYLNLSLVFAFATLYPDYQILFFVLPVRIKWVALLSALLVVWQFVTGDVGTKAAIGASLANYFLFFSGHLVALLKNRRLAVRQAARRAHHSPVAARPKGRVCAICGASQDAGADIRVCSCEKCKPSRSLCLEHARNH
jgi:membrane associated rhomboid family serine protease